jgi:hypothetical protein
VTGQRLPLAADNDSDGEDIPCRSKAASSHSAFPHFYYFTLHVGPK